MELRHLRYFVAVAEEENITRAAAKLHVSQPALSRQIHDLENELGIPLLERSAKKVRLTVAGRVFLTEARAVLDRTSEAVKNVRAAAGGLQGEIHVGYAPSLTVQILPQVLRSFQAEFPGVRVCLHDLSTGEMLAGLHEGRLQLALMGHPRDGQLRGLQARELAHYPLVVAVAPRHPLAALATITREQLAAERLITYNRADYPEYHDALEALLPTGRKPQIVEEHDSVTSLIAAVEAASGVAVVVSCVACMAGARLKLLPLDPPSEPVIVAAVWRDGTRSAMVENFIAAALPR